MREERCYVRFKTTSTVGNLSIKGTQLDPMVRVYVSYSSSSYVGHKVVPLYVHTQWALHAHTHTGR